MNTEETNMIYSHHSIFDRGQLEALHQLGRPARAISGQLNRQHSAIARDIKRSCLNKTYKALTAQRAYQQLRSRCYYCEHFKHDTLLKTLLPPYQVNIIIVFLQ